VSSVTKQINISARKSQSPGLDCDAKEQGDQIGRIFAYWVIVFFGQLFEKYRSRLIFCATLSHEKSCALILAEKCVGYILGESFTNLSGHSAKEDRHFLGQKKCFNKWTLLDDLYLHILTYQISLGT
jgi:hypothetical protein